MKHTYTACRECRWWSRLAEHGSKTHRGECRRYPPSVFFAGRIYYTFGEISNRGFPITSEDWWCGEGRF